MAKENKAVEKLKKIVTDIKTILEDFTDEVYPEMALGWIQKIQSACGNEAELLQRTRELRGELVLYSKLCNKRNEKENNQRRYLLEFLDTFEI